jgi:DNA (cytosine-5)-methyltransferase 1
MKNEKRTFRMVDLFAGAGGFSEGFSRTCAKYGIPFDLTAINHWPTAVETHAANHPNARHFCESVYEVNPLDVAPDGYLDCMTVSPECIYHSNARGGGVCDDQSRSGAKDILRWVSAIEIPTIVIENVREFMTWGPLHKRGPRKGLPMEHRRGEEFRRFCAGLRALGYHIDFAVLNSANYGAYTARERFFMIACKGIPFAGWPAMTHAKNPDRPFVKQWHAARDIIDWSLQGDSLFMRQSGMLEGKKPLVKNTIDRIVWGLQNISGIDPEPFLVLLYGTGTARSIDRPLPVVTTSGNHIALAQPAPFFAKYHGGASGHTRCYGVDEPMMTLDTSNRFSLIEPYIAVLRGQSKSVRVDAPLPTVTAGPGNMNVCDPFLVKYFGNGANAVSVNNPLPTVTVKDRFGLIEPALFDIRYRLLEPHELAAGMGFEGYKFCGTKTDIKKQIGNAVEVNQSAALAERVVMNWRNAA